MHIIIHKIIDHCKGSGDGFAPFTVDSKPSSHMLFLSAFAQMALYIEKVIGIRLRQCGIVFVLDRVR